LVYKKNRVIIEKKGKKIRRNAERRKRLPPFSFIGRKIRKKER
jgi:hypothetical protein